MKYLLLILFFPLQAFTQDITGVWTGYLYNDTTQQKVQYEIVIGEKNGKFTGYSYTIFIVDNRELTGVKSIKITRNKDHIFFEDIDLVYNNYPFDPPKGVRQLTSLTFDEELGKKVLTGKFITTRTRQYGRQVTGTIRLEQSLKPEETLLANSLNKLGLLNDLNIQGVKPDVKDVAFVKEKTLPPPPIQPVEIEKKKPEVIIPKVEPKKDVLTELAKRKIETIQTVFFTSDSLRLALYDNGYVDGDSVSIIVNGKVELENQRLTTQAITKTIATPRGITDSVNIIMYAENLGSIAPNTGLLIIFDGEKRHEISFSGDLQKNAAILLIRKK